MNRFALGLALLGLWSRGRAEPPSAEPPPEVLKDLDFFVQFELIKNLEVLESVSASTDTVHAPLTEAPRSTATAGGKK